jgi:hypothetical protein
LNQNEYCLDPLMLQTTTLFSDMYPDCVVVHKSWVGDGFCDTASVYNTHFCAWDGGDCCEESCSTGKYNCNDVENVFVCIDPDFVVPCDIDEEGYLGDGYCDATGGYNTDACNWDEGDCCSSTCQSTSSYDCGHSGFTCLNPDGSNVDGDCEVGFTSWLGDGLCDTSGNYNTESCSWDLGDCCSDTCESGEDYFCGETDCLDPDSTDYLKSDCSPLFESWLGDGTCDGYGVEDGLYNSKLCGWDGGDCCESTCQNSEDYNCADTNFQCLDEGADDYAPGECSVDFVEWLGDGHCDGDVYNIDSCGWDGGDCCFLTCTPGEYDCDVPLGLCLNTLTCQSDESQVGDGYCDEDSNTELCNWDGGDCCESTCESSAFTCGVESNYDCKIECVGYLTYLGDGYCDSGLNTDNCNWDSGDCCVQSCDTTESFICGQDSSYDCRNPEFFDPSQCNVQYPSRLNDGFCDATTDSNGYTDYNSQMCSWDGGDCCKSTCSSGTFTCSEPFVCLNPEVGACDLTDAGYTMLGDGICQEPSSGLNNAVCGWDGGDCCEETCAAANGCDAFQCLYTGCDVSGNGVCDASDNVARCDWDGGDCCVEGNADCRAAEARTMCIFDEYNGCLSGTPFIPGTCYCDIGCEGHGDCCDDYLEGICDDSSPSVNNNIVVTISPDTTGVDDLTIWIIVGVVVVVVVVIVVVIIVVLNKKTAGNGNGHGLRPTPTAGVQVDSTPSPRSTGHTKRSKTYLTSVDPVKSPGRKQKKRRRRKSPKTTS